MHRQAKNKKQPPSHSSQLTGCTGDGKAKSTKSTSVEILLTIFSI
jgi:hypothetical protein